MLLMYLHHFQCCLKRIQILNVFLTCSNFNVSFLKSLIFLINSTLILLFLKKSKYKCWTKQLGKKTNFSTYKKVPPPHTHTQKGGAIKRKP